MGKAGAAIPPSAERLQALLTAAKPWRMEKKNGQGDNCVPCGGTSNSDSAMLSKDFKFRNFREAWSFMADVAEKAESMNVRQPMDSSTAIDGDVEADLHSPASSGMVKCEALATSVST
ncbi:hypothetical protein EMMF5_000370 [Cystobasidiomycetes sp. EMM_F5]